MKSPLIHLAGQLFDSPLAIVPEKLEVILRSAVGPRLSVDADAWEGLVSSGVLPFTRDLDPKMLSASWDDDDEDSYSSGRKSEKPYKVTDAGVAIIPISGVLMKRGGWMSALSGCSSYSGIDKALFAAMSDPMVKGVLFNVNSPGGSTNGCFELTDKIHGYRGQKPMYAVANDLSASAAYSLASSADRLFVTRTGACGSIGVFSLHCSQSKLDDKIGVEYTYIHYGAKKVDGNEHEALSKSAKSDIQAEVDRQGDIFTNTVARNRKTSFESIRALQAGVLFADRSVPLLADAVGTYADALTELSGKVNKSSGTIHMTGGQPPVVGSVGSTGVMPEGVADMDAAELAKLQADFAKSQADLEAANAANLKLKAEADTKKSAKPPADDEPDGDEDCAPDMKKKGKEAATAMPTPTATDRASELEAIAELCTIAGRESDLPKFIQEKKTLAEVRKVFRDARAAESSDPAKATNPGFGTSFSAEPLDKIQSQVATMVSNSNGTLTPSQAMERVLGSNPELYADYNDGRQEAALTPRRSAAYLSQLAPKLRAYGLSSITT